MAHGYEMTWEAFDRFMQRFGTLFCVKCGRRLYRQERGFKPHRCVPKPGWKPLR